MSREMSTELQLILTLTAFPPGVVFAVQQGRDGLWPPYAASAESISFAITMDIGPALADGSFNFRGPFAQGTPADRFVYVNSGGYAGQQNTPWERRAKIQLGGIPRGLVEAAAGDPDRAIEGRIHGTMPDGGPVCATVHPPLLHWQLVARPR